MITDARRSICVSSLGWVDSGSLWVYDLTGQGYESISVGDAEYLSLHSGGLDHFSVLHHRDGSRVDITVHDFRDPGKVLAGLRVTAQGSEGWGDSEAWASVPRHYTAYLVGPYWSGPCLIRLGVRHEVEVQQFLWHAEEYDAVYQGIVGATEIPGCDLVVLSIQRDSHPVLYDPVTRERVGRISLGDRGGGPTLQVARHSDDVWVDDYDTLLRLDRRSWRTLASRKLQDAKAGARQFMGAYWVYPEEDRIAVARPFSGDVIEVDAQTLETTRSSKTGGEPLEAAVLADDSIVARDWKTGDLIRGRWD